MLQPAAWGCAAVLEGLDLKAETAYSTSTVRLQASSYFTLRISRWGFVFLEELTVSRLVPWACPNKIWWLEPENNHFQLQNHQSEVIRDRLNHPLANIQINPACEDSATSNKKTMIGWFMPGIIWEPLPEGLSNYYMMCSSLFTTSPIY